MEFDKSKILTVVTADQANVGSMGYFSNYIPTLEGYVTGHIKPDKLTRVSLNTIYPFLDGHNYYSLFYPAPEPTYAERQAQWVKENNVKAGTKVRVTRTFTEDEDGSRCLARNDLVGKTGIIRNILTHMLDIEMNDGNFRLVPYFALEVIKEPTYRPYKNAEEFKPYRDKWFVDNLNGRFKIDWHSDTHIYEYGNSFITWEEAFSKYKFEDGTPFGVKEEV